MSTELALSSPQPRDLRRSPVSAPASRQRRVRESDERAPGRSLGGNTGTYWRPRGGGRGLYQGPCMSQSEHRAVASGIWHLQKLPPSVTGASPEARSVPVRGSPSGASPYHGWLPPLIRLAIPAISSSSPAATSITNSYTWWLVTTLRFPLPPRSKRPDLADKRSSNQGAFPSAELTHLHMEICSGHGSLLDNVGCLQRSR